MSEREAYSYTVLRYVHDVLTGEFVNVGVVLHAASGLRSQFRMTSGRVSRVFPSLDRKAFSEAIRSVRSAVERLEKKEQSAGLFRSSPDALAFAQKALAADDSSFQWSPPGSGLTGNASATLLDLFERFVGRYDQPGQDDRHRGDADVWKPIREKLERYEVADRLRKQTFVGQTDTITFEHAWKNGKWHAIKPLSLDLADDDEVKKKAYRLRGHLDSVADGLIEELSLSIVLGAPSDPALQGAYQSARTILQKAAVHTVVVEESQIDDLVARLADEIHAHDLD